MAYAESHGSETPMWIRRGDLQWAVDQGLIGDTQAHLLWIALRQRTAASQPAFNGEYASYNKEDGSSTPSVLRLITIPQSLSLTLLAFYCGALIIVAAMIWLLVVAWRESKAALFWLSLTYVLVLGGIGLYIWLRGRRFDIPQVVGGLLVTVSVCVVPIAVLALQDWTHTYYYQYPFVFAAPVTVLVGGITLYFVRFPLITAPMAFMVYLFGVVDLPNVLFPG